MNFTELSDCELLVMKCLWEEDGELTVKDLLERMESRYGKKYKETTVYTFLKRMKDKQFITSRKQGTSYFSALVSQEDYLRDYSQRFADFLGKDASRTFLSAFFQRQKFSDQELEEIRKLSDELD